MVSLQEAMAHAKNQFPNRKIVDGYEYETVFVFNMIPKGANISSSFFDSLVSVNKKTKKVLIFQPWYISNDEYDKGEKVI